MRDDQGGAAVHEPVERAVQRVLSGDPVSVYQNSNYGRALRAFADGHLEREVLGPSTLARNHHQHLALQR